MDFKKFPEIENMTPDLVNYIREQGYGGDTPWCVTAKIDGCNFQVALDVDGTIHYGSRNQELGKYDQFNNYQHAVAKNHLEEKVRALKELLDSYWLLDILDYGPYALVVFFEMCGGVYRHKDVEPVKDAIKIQGRVSYHPDNVFVCLDIFWYSPGLKEGEWLSPETVNEMCDKIGIPHQQILAKLPFEEAIKYPNDGEDTTGPALFGLPQIPHNIMEGVVLKPWNAFQFKNGARVWMKNKNQIFLERGIKTNKIKNPPTPMSPIDEQMFANYMTYITESRMMSVLSKMDTSNITSHDFGKLLKAFIDDADKDFMKEFGGKIKVMEQELPLEEFNFMKVIKAAKTEAAKMLRPMFIEFLNKNKTEELDA